MRSPAQPPADREAAVTAFRHPAQTGRRRIRATRPTSACARHRAIRPAAGVAGCTRPGSSPGSSFVALIGAAGFRSAPGVLMIPLQDEFGWSRGLLSVAVGVNLILYGLTAPFAAALMDRFGIRRITCSPWCWSRSAAG